MNAIQALEERLAQVTRYRDKTAKNVRETEDQLEKQRKYLADYDDDIASLKEGIARLSQPKLRVAK